MTRSCRVGLHGRNDTTFAEIDYQLIRNANIETLKMMGQTRPEVFQRIKSENPGIEFITRLYDGDNFGVGKHPSPQEFAARQLPIIRRLQPFCTKFEIHNEPNHYKRWEGWGQEDHFAQDFNRWFLEVYALLKKGAPWAQFGFPGLAIPHRDLEWIKICRPAIEKADWLGVHCYWQTPPGQERNHLNDAWGLRFKYYHDEFPQKIIEITECGNSNIQAEPPIPISEADMAQQFVEYYQELFRYPYINSASFFIQSSPSAKWDFFAWRSESGRMKPVVPKVGKMSRPALIPAQAAAPIFTSPGSGTTIGGNYSLPPLTIKNIAASLPHSATAQYPTRARSAINQIVIHHTAISEKVGPERIAQVQVSQQHKPGITYHYFIAADGTVYQTNPVTVQTDHTPGHSANSVAIAFAGNFTAAIPTNAQLRSGSILCATLMLEFNIPPANIVGAKELIATESPGKQWMEGQNWKNMLMTQIYQLRTAPSGDTSTPTTSPASGEELAKLAQQLADALTANQIAQQKIAVLEAELARLRNQPPAPTPSESETIADLKERIAELEFQLAVARKQLANGSGDSAPVTSPAPTAPAVPPPAIENIVAQLPHHPTVQYPTRTVSEITMVVVHHTGVSPTITAREIAEFRVQKNNWAGIGFHFLVLPDGTIQQTNELTTVSRHAGDQNRESVGVSFAGNFNTGSPTAQQIAQGGHLIAWLLRTLNLSIGAMVGHKAIASTPCPGTQWDSGSRWQNSLRQAVNRWLSGSAQPTVPATDTTPVQPPPSSAKTIFHYLLLGSATDQSLATNYIAKFQPTVGTDAGQAQQARYVTIVGSAVSAATEQQLRAAGCNVERVAGNSPLAIRALLDNMARTGRRFLTFQGV